MEWGGVWVALAASSLAGTHARMRRLPALRPAVHTADLMHAPCLDAPAVVALDQSPGSLGCQRQLEHAGAHFRVSCKLATPAHTGNAGSAS